MQIAPVNAKQFPSKSVEARKTTSTALRLTCRIYIGPALLLSATSERAEADLLASPGSCLVYFGAFWCDLFYLGIIFPNGDPWVSSTTHAGCVFCHHAHIYISGTRFVYQ